MRETTLVYLLILLLLSVTPATAGALLHGDFEDEGKSWTIVGDPQAVQFTTERPAQGRISLRLQATESTAGWAVSAPLQDLPAGPLQLSMQACHISGAAELAVAFVYEPPAQPQAINPLWHIRLPADGKWHRLQIGLVVPRTQDSPLHLAVGLIGGQGLWEVDDLEIAEYLPPSQTSPGPSADIPAATAPMALPPGWEPEDDLDAIRRRVGSDEELLVNVSGLRISIIADAIVERGIRQGLLTYVVNRGDVPKQLTVSIHGPPGTFMPDYTVPIAPRGTTRFFPLVQMLRTGDWWVKITFSSGGQSASMPIRVQCRPTYPAFGLTMKDPWQLLPEPVSQSLRRLPVQFYHIPVASGEDGSLATIAEVISQLDAEVGLQLPQSDANASGGELVAQVQQSAAQISEALPGADLISPPFSLTATPTGLAASPQLADALTAGLAPLVDSLAVRLPPLPGGAILAEHVDGRPRPELNAYWADIDRQFDFASLPTYLDDTGAYLPLILTELGKPATGDARLDALLTSRLIIKAFAQRATAATILARPDDYTTSSNPTAEPSVPPLYLAVAELSRELCGAVPLACLADTPGFSSRQDCPVVYRVFRREDEGIVFMWNNTSAPLDVAVLLHCMPRQLHLVRLSYWGDFVTRQFQGLFAFSEEAERNKQSAVYVRISPLQIVGLTFNLRGIHSGWLRKIAPRPPVPERRRPTPQEHFPWGLDRP